MYARHHMLTYYQVTRPRKIKVRVVKAHDHVPYLGSKNVVDTRQDTKKGFGRTFFLNLNERRLTELESWSKLEKRLRKRMI